LQIGRNNRLSLTRGALLPALAVALFVGGCQQARNDPSATGALDTGTYPNLNVKPGVANQQLSAEETAAAKAELAGSAAANAGRNSGVPRDEAYLKWLAAQHDKEALKKIEEAQ
jgi:hypothetical protein